MEHRYIILGLVYGVIFFATLMAILAVRLHNLKSANNAPTLVPEAQPELPAPVGEDVRLVPRIETEPTSMDEIHERYRELAETDPRLAGLLKYQDQLKLHGK